jgi:hypothetical protein
MHIDSRKEGYFLGSDNPSWWNYKGLILPKKTFLQIPGL